MTVGFEQQPALIVRAQHPTRTPTCSRKGLTGRAADHALDSGIAVLGRVELGEVLTVHLQTRAKFSAVRSIGLKSGAVGRLNFDGADNLVSGSMKADIETSRAPEKRLRVTMGLSPRRGVGQGVS